MQQLEKETKMTINDYLADPKNLRKITFYQFRPVVCKDGFKISVQASEFAYCGPRDNYGPWTTVECGYPSATPAFILEFAETMDEPCNTVYPYTPVELVDKLIEAHGGFSNEQSKEGVQ